MVTSILIGVCVLFVLAIGVLGLIALFLLFKKKKPSVLPPVVSSGSVSEPTQVHYYPAPQLSIREQMIQEKLDAITKDFLKRHNEKFEADSVAEYKGLLG